jgi:hypothetical protein
MQRKAETAFIIFCNAAMHNQRRKVCANLEEFGQIAFHWPSRSACGRPLFALRTPQ